MKELADLSDDEIVVALGAKRLFRLVGSIRGRLQTPHAGQGAPCRPTECARCGMLQPSAGLAKAHCKEKDSGEGIG